MREWEKPKLVVLSRGRPEEHVLEACKSSKGGKPGSADGSCYKTCNDPCYNTASS